LNERFFGCFRRSNLSNAAGPFDEPLAAVMEAVADAQVKIS
jgi:hypothetical protein